MRKEAERAILATTPLPLLLLLLSCLWTSGGGSCLTGSVVERRRRSKEAERASLVSAPVMLAEGRAARFGGPVVWSTDNSARLNA